VSADDDRPGQPPPLTPRRLLAGIKLGWALRKGYRSQLDDPAADPSTLGLLNERSSAIVDQAGKSAGSDFDDRTATGKLAEIAAGHPYDLRVAVA
jgi:hypothetical protein